MHQSKVRSLTRSIMGLFGANKSNVKFLNSKDEYYKNYYFNQKLCNGIRIVADIELTSKKQAAELLMRAGHSSYMGSKVTEQIEMERAARELNQKVKATRFLRELRKLAKSKSMDISKFINNIATLPEASFFNVFDSFPVMIVHKKYFVGSHYDVLCSRGPENLKTLPLTFKLPEATPLKYTYASKRVPVTITFESRVIIDN